jgi:hypothetical protein
MDRRLELHKILKNILESDNVYFQPPPSVNLHYPCIVYERSTIQTTKADNIKYLKRVRYTITLIGLSPESEIVNKILDLPLCTYDRFYTTDGLNHDVFSLYY